MGNKRTPIGKFIHSTWGNLKLRTGKNRQNTNKNKCYENIANELSYEEYKQWCIKNEKLILSLNRPSLDRIDSNKNYRLDNIQIIELIENIRKKRAGNRFINGSEQNKIRGVKKVGKKWVARITIKRIENYLGTFETKEEALQIFSTEYYRNYNKYPW